MERLSAVTAVILLLAIAQMTHARTLQQALLATSSLWGVNGENFKIGGRLLDYSYAGYNAGETTLPNLVPSHNVKNFGAKGDGATDDTAAFHRAFDTLNSGDVLRIPAGKYVLTSSYTFKKSISLKGDGSSKTELIVAEGVAGGLFTYWARLVRGKNTLLASAKDGKRGQNTVTVSGSGSMKAGQWVVIVMGAPRVTSTDRFLSINMGLDKGCEVEFCSGYYMHISRISKILDSTHVELERPLPWDMYPLFQPTEVHVYKPNVHDFGVEGLRFTMKSSRYLGHFKETGFNALQYDGIVNAWVRDVHITDADMGIVVARSGFMTITDVTLDSTPGRYSLPSAGNFTGHHGITVTGSDNLIQKFVVNTRFVHDLSVDKLGQTAVYSDGQGIDLNMDHHKAQNYATLWTQIYVGIGSRPFASGGSGGRGPDAGAFTTFWNIWYCMTPKQCTGVKGSQFYEKERLDFGPYLNFVGTSAATFPPPSTNPMMKSWLIENIDFSKARPANLYQAQLAIRLANPSKVSVLLGGKGLGGGLLSGALTAASA